MIQAHLIAVLYSQLTISLTSLVIIIVLYYSTILTSTFAAVLTYIISRKARPGGISPHYHCFFHNWICFAYGITILGVLPLFLIRNIMELRMENTASQLKYRSIISARHQAFYIPSRNEATWQQQYRLQRPIGTWDISLETITISQ